MQKNIILFMVSILSLFMLTSCIYQHKTNISESKNIKNTSEETTEIISKIEENTPETEAESVNYEITNIVFTPINDSIGNRYYCGIVEILNTGTKPIYLQDCVFDLEDNNKHLLKSDNFLNKCPSVIQSGEKGYFFNSSGKLDNSISLDNGINLVPNISIKEATGNYILYDVSDTSMRIDSIGAAGYPVVTGRITNNSNEDESLPCVYVVYYDENKIPIDIEITYAGNTIAGASSSFECSSSLSPLFRHLGTDKIEDYKVFAESIYFQF